MGTTAQKLNRVLQTKSDLKTVINYSGANITNETTFKDYPKLLNKAYIDILNDEGESLYNALPKTTGTGTSIDLDVEKGKMKLKLKANTQQNTSILPSGYTQVDYIEGHRAEYIDTGFKATPETRIEATFQFTQVTPVQQRIFGNSYSETDGLIFTTYINGSGNFGWGCQNNTGNWTSTGITVNTNKHTFIVDSLNNSVSVDNYNATITSTRTNNSVKTMLLFTYRDADGMAAGTSLSYLKMYSTKIYDNNVLVRDFIPCYRNSDNVVGMYDLVNGVFYTNQGTGAFTYGSVVNIPNPDYPQDIHVITGDNNIKIQNKNLFDKDNANVINAYISGGKKISSSGDDRLIYISCKPNTTYSLQKMLQGTTGYNRFRIGTTTNVPVLDMYVEDYFNAGDGSTLTTKTITTGANANYLVFYCYRVDTLTSFEEMLDSIQIEEGSTATEYVEHQSQNYPIDLGNLEYCELGNYADQLFKNTTDSEFYDSTLLENEWYLKKKIGKVILNGDSNESYGYQNNHRFFLRRSYWTNDTAPFNPPQNALQGLYCNRFVERTRNQTWGGIEGISYDNPNTVDQPIGSTFDIACNSVATNENDFKAWLSTNNLIVYYILQNINIIHISETDYPTLHQQLENIYNNVKSYEGDNYITQTNDDLPFNLEVSALAKIE